MPTKTTEQRRAEHAWNAVSAFMNNKAHGSDKREKYALHARKLPIRIIASGLGQSLAFLVAKDYCPDLLVSLSQWCLNKGAGTPVLANALLLEIIKGDSEQMRRHTAESLAYLKWVVRFVEASNVKSAE